MRTVYGPIFTLRPYERGIQEALGKYNRFVMPGLGFQIPLIHVLRVRDIREHTMDIHPQPVITRDNVEIQVDGIMWARPTLDEESIKRTFYNIDDWKRAIIQLAMTNLRQAFGDLTLDESLAARTTIAARLQQVLNAAGVEWGLTVSKVEIRLIDPPEDIKKAMHQQRTAEQGRRSMRLLAPGEFEAAGQQKLVIIQRAEGEREAVVQVVQERAEAVRLDDEAAQQYFAGNAQALKQMEMVEISLRENAKVVITEHGVSPTMLLGGLPIGVSDEKNGQIEIVRV